MDERTALEAMAAGDETALGWFIGRYAAYAATIINNMLLPRLSEADAEEALADVFVSLWRSAARIRPEGVRTYIAAIARNRALDALRAHRLTLPLEDDILSLPSPGPDEAIMERELIERAAAAVDAMPEPDRGIFLRRYYYGRSVAEIAAALDMNVNTVKTRLRRGRERLRAELMKGDE